MTTTETDTDDPFAPAEPPPDPLAGLTEQQLAAVTHRNGPCIVVAGAGSGKTRVITRRIAHLMATGVKGSSIVAITFTNKAAGEMRERLEHLCPGHKAWVSTFHSMAVRLLRDHSFEAGLSRSFTIADEDDRLKVVRQCVAAVGADQKRFLAPAVADEISRAKNFMLLPVDVWSRAEDSWLKMIGLIYSQYQRVMWRMGLLDFDDLLLMLVQLLSTNETVRRALDERFRFMLVDEFQDVNLAQSMILKLLNRNENNLMVVGDSDQLIYSFRGSDIRHFLSFEQEYPGTKLMPLNENFRSTPEVISAANVVIRNNPNRIKKELVTANPSGVPVTLHKYASSAAEANAIGREVLSQVGTGARTYSDFAVLIRLHTLSKDVEAVFIKGKIPYRIVGGMTFFERKEVKDALAYVKLAINPNDSVSFLRAVNEPTRGIGKAALDRLTAYTAEIETSHVYACDRAELIPGLTQRNVVGMKTFADLIRRLHLRADDAAALVEAAVKESGLLKQYAESEEDEDLTRGDNLLQLIDIAKSFCGTEKKSAVEFLELVTLSAHEEEEDEDRDKVTISTLHAAKGLEWPVVFLPAVEGGIFPHKKAFEATDYDGLAEERRLFFVGITRAREQLVLSYSNFRIVNGSPVYQVPSQFLDELPQDEIDS